VECLGEVSGVVSELAPFLESCREMAGAAAAAVASGDEGGGGLLRIRSSGGHQRLRVIEWRRGVPWRGAGLPWLRGMCPQILAVREIFRQEIA
jgi:hypothetical protein